MNNLFTKIYQSLDQKKVAITVVGVLLAIQFGLGVYLADTDAQTADESVHITAGYSYLTRQDFSWNPEHPPLVKEIAAFPLLFVKLNASVYDQFKGSGSDYFYDNVGASYSLGETFFYNSGNNADQILLLTRIPIVILTLILGIIIFLAAVKFWGWRSGVFATTLYAFDPTIMAHGHLVTTDIGAALGCLIALLALWKLLNHPTWKNGAIWGLILGISLLLKFTLIMLFPISAVLAIFFFIAKKKSFKEIVSIGLKLIVPLILTWVVIWAGYDFQTTPPPPSQNIVLDVKTTNNNFVSSADRQGYPTIDKIYSSLRYALIPRYYFKGLTQVISHTHNGHSSYLLGKTSTKGWWYYFPTVFFYKTPIASLFTLLLFIYVLFINRRKNRQEAIYLFLGAATYMIFAMTSKADLGIRHILPIYPLLFISFGYLVLFPKIFKLFVLPITILLIVEFASVFPYYLSFFNLFAGGPYNGVNIATDSNLDWGQDLKRVKIYLDKNNIQNPYFEYNWQSLSGLDHYHIIQKGTASETTADGYLVIGAMAIPSPMYGWLKERELVAQITPSVFLYNLKH